MARRFPLPSSQLTRPLASPYGVFGFGVLGPVGSNVVIQVSADLNTWIPLQTKVLVNGTVHFSDLQPPANREQFCRAMLN